MKIEEAHKKIITGPERFNRGRVCDCRFAVFVNKDYNIDLMHMTDRRDDIIARDLKARGRKIYKEFVGIYNFEVELSDFAGDVHYVVDLLNTPKVKQREARGGNEYLH